MRNLIFFISFILFGSHISAQIYDPVTWDFSYEKKGEKQYELIFTANIEKNSHIYSMDIPSGGPIPTSFRIDSFPGYKLDGKPFEVTKPIEVLDDAFGFKIKTFSNTAEFRQKITAVAYSFTVKGAVNFMACNNATCSPPKDVEFEIKIGDKTNNGNIKSNITTGDVSGPVKSERGLLKFFLISLLAGFAGVLTPCVFPMIPMTVAFFSRGSEENVKGKAVFKALVFGISIVLIYASLGIIVSLTSAGAGFANALSTHWIPNTIFFILFIVFAVSFFGLTREVFWQHFSWD
jgi:thiol:disulfide interchange protein DsbD